MAQSSDTPPENQVTIDDMVLDASLSERHTSLTEITRHPVEVGVSPTDHARIQPQKVVVEGMFSNTLTSLQMQKARGGESQPGKSGASQTLFYQLRDLQRSRRAVSITTSLSFYDNMVLTSLEVPRDPRTGDAVRFTATFEQVVFVRVGTATLPSNQKDQTQAVKKVEQGKKQPVPVTDPATKARVRSNFLKLGAGLGIPGLRDSDPQAAP